MFNPRLYARKAFGAAFAPPFSPFRSSVSSSYCSHSALSSHRNSLLFVSTSRTIRPSLDSYPSRVNTYRNFTMQATGGSSSTTSKQADDPKEKFLSFLDTRKTVVLATTSPNGEAHASAVPFIHEGQLENLYVFVSDLSEHTAHLRANPRVGALLVSDESETKQPFARTRSSFECDVVMMERGTAECEAIVDKFAAQFGSIIAVLRELDFRVFRLTPTSGRFVMGFGKAFDFDLDNWPGMKHVDPSKENPR